MTSETKPARGAGLRAGWVEVDVKKLREGMTVQEAARRSGVSRRAWQRWEKDGRMPQDALDVFRDSTARKVAT